MILLFRKLPEDNPQTHILVDESGDTYIDRDYALQGLSEEWLRLVGYRRDAQGRMVALYNLP